MVARVVLPRPGGPYSRMWSAASSRWRAAWSSTDRLALTSPCPMYSARVLGRRLPSTTSSTSSGSADRMRETSSTIRADGSTCRAIPHACSTARRSRVGRASTCERTTTRLGIPDYDGPRDATLPPLRVRPARPGRPRPARGLGPHRPGRPRPAQQPAPEVPGADHGHAQARRHRPDHARARTAATPWPATRRRSRSAGWSASWTAPWLPSPASRCATTATARAPTRRPARCAT